MINSNIYNIVCVSDEGYVQHTAVMLCSLFETNKDKIFHIYFLTTGITNDSKEKLEDLCNLYSSEFIIKQINTDNIIDLPVGQWHTIMYLKLYMPNVLPDDEDRCLFLDVDMIINADIAPLYNIDLNGHVLAAAEDIPDCMDYKPRLGLIPEDLYINSGVLVCDLKVWREMEYKQPIFDFTRNVASKIQNEQDVIAMYFKNKIKCLPIRWNITTFYFRRVPMIFDKYLPQLKEAKQNPGIIHFACPIKPWFRDCNHPLGYQYLRYLKLTAWGNIKKFPFFEQLTLRQRFNKQIKDFLNRIGILQYEDYLTK
ncbi:glycosyltransferase family 8 protein [Plebeiibacterium sediminum]|uniref:Glycosyltransferase family 8 protein n=1 Tax=Plebeiibacterium sediminum TaxID=2992112 RepID=A0AAE3M3W0_9BACT|nr:glycosyltransferase family 8 protein [Plebeiobacterium sediminum]MCW3786659.1 glycosyltransferase family 8 protein [Plebeiobacterium sediminum]